ncbi:MAG: 3-dehydroquinate synthase II [Methanosarcinaceae archaeon]|nr:3-dehydroquinate synthase II [Methanosarcinaceae archaeon]
MAESGMKLWIRADLPDDRETRKELVISALESGIRSAVVRPEDADLSSVGKIDLYFISGNVISGNGASGILCELKSPEDQKKILDDDVSARFSFVVLGRSDMMIIPLENMIAHFRKKGTEVFAVASSADETAVFSQTLECGADGILIETPENDPSALPGLVSDIRRALSGSVSEQFSTLRITSVRPVGMGDRVCIDTCTMMSPGEGMLIGSQSSCLFLIQSESEDSGYVAPRPFRVNAGAVHSYILVPGGKTKYLSELKAGDPVLIAGRSGKTDAAVIGRCKTERRPLILIEACPAGKDDSIDEKNDSIAERNDHRKDAGEKQPSFSVILQNAETVRMIGPEGAVSVSALREGCLVYARIENGGRHFGTAVEETIRETR